MKALARYLADARSRVDKVLAASTTGDEVVRYSLLGEGKRLRPTLVFAAHDALNGSAAAGVADLAAAVEVVHAYSLVHDDLPCMDNDDLRRGRPTAHRAFDVPRATRAGYDMVALAARVLAHGLEALGLPPLRRREISLELFRAAGAGGMIGGQALDLEAEDLDLDEALKLFEEGVERLRVAREQLSQAELKVKKVLEIESPS